MKMINRNKWKVIGLSLLTAVLSSTLFCACNSMAKTPDPTVKGETGADIKNTPKNQTQEPYAVKSVLKENSAVDPKTGEAVYTRYAELTAAEDAPEALKNAISGLNKKAAGAAEARLKSVKAGMPKEKVKKNSFSTYEYIVAAARADRKVYSILETECETSPFDFYKGSEVSYRFRGSTFDTETGKEIALSDIVGNAASLPSVLEKALEAQYGIAGLAGTESEDYAWTADALGVRFYFHSGAVSEEKRKEIGDYSNDVITVGIPYDVLTGEAAKKLAEVPDAYIARMDLETMYDLPHGDLSVMLTKDGENTVIRMVPDKGEEKSWIIEHADKQSDYFIIRNMNGFYLFRERIGYEEGFFYDFSRPDGGYGRFAYNTAQYFDSHMRKIRLALPYNPNCVQMNEVKRSFGEKRYDDGSFIPYGHYSFPDKADSRYKRFVLLGDELLIDTQNTACRLLEDLTATEVDDQGKELAGITVKAGSSIIFEAAAGEADRYQIPTKRGKGETACMYTCRLSDGRKIRLSSKFESAVYVNDSYLNRYAEPVSLAEGGERVVPDEREAFTVTIGGKEYPVIPDYTKQNHVGEEIDFGGDIWWQAEGYVGRFETTEKDMDDLQNTTHFGPASDANRGVLEIGKDGSIRLEYAGSVYEGVLPEKRYYGEHVSFSLKSEKETRSFSIMLRDSELHAAPDKISLYSEGLPATNRPSMQPPIEIYLSR